CRVGAIFRRKHGAKSYYRARGRLILLAGGWGLSGMNSSTAVSDISERAPRAFAPFRRDGDRAFRPAFPHSPHVRILRVPIPPSAVTPSAGGPTIPFLFNPLGALPGRPGGRGRMVASGTKITRNQLRLAGVPRASRRYDMLAQAAAQDITKPDMVELQGIHAT